MGRLWNGFGTRELADANVAGFIWPSVDAGQIDIGYEMNRVSDGRRLTQSSLKIAAMLAFTNQLDRHPTMAMWLNSSDSLRHRSRTNLRHDSK